jgi:hypothetical protein
MSKLIEGPHGHWYALFEGELVARPMHVGDQAPPEAPIVDFEGNEVGFDGCYAPDDLQGDERAQVLPASPIRGLCPACECRRRGWFVRLSLDDRGQEPCGPGEGVPDRERLEFYRRHGFHGLWALLPGSV